MVDWRKQWVRNGGVSLAVFEVAGSAADDSGEHRPTVLLVHGWPDTHHLWTHVAPALARDFHVVAYDCRGFGESDRPEGDAAYRLDALADDLFAVGEAVSPERPIHVVGHDWGSVQAWEAVTQPGAESRIASFVSVSGPNLDQLGAWARKSLSRPTPRHVKDVLAQAGSSAYTVFFQLPVVPRLFFGVAGSPTLWREFLHLIEGTPRANVIVGDTLRADMISGLRLYRANIRAKLADPRTRPTSVPTLELVNERDIALRPAIFDDTHRYTQRLWRRSTPTGHWLPYTNPDHLVRSASDFIATHASRSTPAIAARVDRTRVFGTPHPLSGKLAVITGAGSGIGRETAFALAEQGCELILADIDLAGADETARQSKALGTQASPYELDVADVGALAAFAESVRDRHGTPDIVINNAGIGLAGSVLAATDEQVDRLLGVNLRGVISGSRVFGRLMAERGIGGHIVNVSSAAAFTPQRSLGLYSASKAGVLLFSESLRAELGEHRIGVSAICPGIVDTHIVSATPIAGLPAAEEETERRRLDGLYRRRGFTPDRVAREIVDAIIGNKAVVPVTPEAKIGYRIYRFTPWLSRLGARQKVVG
ncbi:SDR family oxidoreductase [Gordonia sp. HNM0687]|uniref:SDR family oxidoreductase n=1 Tax=Gordonia mangrovi TaxID=2665643 RepID=A0A6L7GUC2_9ACTN|nr:SDR family oxidoreductase [Gordonia mangrovi]MXP23604.1 SDR family oxidoreductase [Gordonia mangrovi]UVF79670.1 SDR family oxidoreductase [Gordonia mangrovi]